MEKQTGLLLIDSISALHKDVPHIQIILVFPDLWENKRRIKMNCRINS